MEQDEEAQEEEAHEEEAQVEQDYGQEVSSAAIWNLSPDQAQAQAQAIKLMKFKMLPWGLQDWQVPIPVGPKEHVSKVVILPCGLKLLGLGPGPGPLTQEQMALAIDQVHSLNKIVYTPPTLFLDVRGATVFRPPKVQRLSSHIGFHDTIMQQVMAQRDVVQNVRNLVYDFFETFGTDPGHSAQWSIVIACKSGKHRSIAWSAILTHCLAQRGYVARRYFAAVDWQGTCEGKCDECVAGPSDATLLKAKLAMSMWTVGA